MTDMKLIYKGFTFFLISYLAMIIMNSMFSEMFSALSPIATAFGFADPADYVWFLIILLWFLMGIVIPSYLFYKGISEQGQNEDKLLMAFSGIIIFLTSLVLTYKGYFMIQALSQTQSEPLITVIFWLGTTIQWILITFVLPYSLIIKAWDG